MRTLSNFRPLFVVLLFGSTGLLSGCQTSLGDSSVSAQETASTRLEPVASNGSGQPVRAQETLSEPVMRGIQVVQELQLAAIEAGGAESDMAPAKAALDQLYAEHFETGNGFEKMTILNFYTNYYLQLANYPEAIRVFEQLLAIENLRDDIRLRALRSLGQLTAAEERWQESIGYYDSWREASDRQDEIVYRGIAHAYYQLEDFEQSVLPWRAYMELRAAEGAELTRDDYAFLNGLYYSLERYDEALETTKEMILKFNNDRDWENLRRIYRELDEPGFESGADTSDV